jgi:hypothetical protein
MIVAVQKVLGETLWTFLEKFNALLILSVMLID